MKTTPLQRFKSKLIVGARCTFHAKWCPNPTIRTIVEVQTKQVCFSHPTRPDAKGSWLNMPKASEIVEFAPDNFVVDGGTNNPLYYNFNI